MLPFPFQSLEECSCCIPTYSPYLQRKHTYTFQTLYRNFSVVCHFISPPHPLLNPLLLFLSNKGMLANTVNSFLLVWEVNQYLRPCRMFSFRRSNGWHKPGMHLDTTCLFAKNAHDCWAPNTTGANSGKSCCWQESVLPILSEPQGSLVLCSPFAPFPAMHPLLDLAKPCSHPFSSSWVIPPLPKDLSQDQTLAGTVASIVPSHLPT